MTRYFRDIFFVLCTCSLIFFLIISDDINVTNLFSKSNTTFYIEELTNNISYFDNGIPKLLHYTYQHNLLPIQYQQLMENCLQLNPDVKFIFWSDNAALDLVKLYYPYRRRQYESYVNNEFEKLKKSDLIRSVILHRYGGIYMDLDTRCQKPFRFVMVNESCFVSTDVDIKIHIMYDMEFVLMNSLMGCIKQHRFFEYFVSRIDYNRGGPIHFTTGPFALTELFKSYKRLFLDPLNANRSSNKQQIPEKTAVTLGRWQTFSPLLDKDLSFHCYNLKRLKVGSPRQRGCIQYSKYKSSQKKDITDATTVHLFLNLGYTLTKIKTRFDISNYPQVVLAENHLKRT